MLVPARVTDDERHSEQVENPFQLGEHGGVIKVSRVRFERFARAGTVPTLTVSSLEKLAVRSSGVKRAAPPTTWCNLPTLLYRRTYS